MKYFNQHACVYLQDYIFASYLTSYKPELKKQNNEGIALD